MIEPSQHTQEALFRHRSTALARDCRVAQLVGFGQPGVAIRGAEAARNCDTLTKTPTCLGGGKHHSSIWQAVADFALSKSRYPEGLAMHRPSS
jgi:hypothetical protein